MRIDNLLSRLSELINNSDEPPVLIRISFENGLHLMYGLAEEKEYILKEECRHNLEIIRQKKSNVKEIFFQYKIGYFS